MELMHMATKTKTSGDTLRNDLVATMRDEVSKSVSAAIALAQQTKKSDVYVGIGNQSGSFISAFGMSGVTDSDGVTTVESPFKKGVIATSTGKDKRGKRLFSKKRSIGEADEYTDSYLSGNGCVPCPWNRKELRHFLISNPMHAGALLTKADDYAYSGWELELTSAARRRMEQGKLSKDIVETAREEVTTFLESCAQGLSVEDLARDVAIESEAYGNFAIEIIRDSMTGRIIELIPVSFVDMYFTTGLEYSETGARYKQIKGNKRVNFIGFMDNVEFADRDGEVVDNFRRMEIDDFPEYDKRDDSVAIVPNTDKGATASKDKGEPFVSDATSQEAATELYVMARRPLTQSELYGTPSGIQAVNAMRAMGLIEKFNLQFFSAKGVPQYAVIIKGLTMPEGSTAVPGERGDGTSSVDAAAMLTNTITEFFTNKLMAGDRSVLVFSAFGETEVQFERLTSEEVEASFGDYEKRCQENIRLAHRTPGPAMGILDTANLGSGRDSAQLRRYREHIIGPGQRFLAKMINDIILYGLFIPYFRFKFMPMSVEDAETKRRLDLKEFELGGTTATEYREKQGMDTPKVISEDPLSKSLILRTSMITPIGAEAPEGPNSAAAALRVMRAKDHRTFRDILNSMKAALEATGTQDDDEDYYETNEDTAVNGEAKGLSNS